MGGVLRKGQTAQIGSCAHLPGKPLKLQRIGLLENHHATPFRGPGRQLTRCRHRGIEGILAHDQDPGGDRNFRQVIDGRERYFHRDQEILHAVGGIEEGQAIRRHRGQTRCHRRRENGNILGVFKDHFSSLAQTQREHTFRARGDRRHRKRHLEFFISTGRDDVRGGIPAHLPAIQGEAPGQGNEIGQTSVVEDAERPLHLFARAKRPIPLAAQDGDRLPSLVDDRKLAALPKMKAHAVPAVPFGQHPQFPRNGRACLGLPEEGLLATDRRVVAQFHPRHEGGFSQENRLVLRHRPDLAMGEAGLVVRSFRIRGDRRFHVVPAVDRLRFVKARIAAVNHHGPGRIQLHEEIGRLFHFGRGDTILPGHMAVDESDLIFHRPDKNRGVIALTPGPGQELFPIVIPQGVSFQTIKTGGALPVEDARASHRHSLGIALIQVGLRLIGRPPNTHHALSMGSQLFDIGGVVIGKAVKGDAVEFEIASRPGPFPEAKFGFPFVHHLAPDGDPGYDVVLLGIVLPPKFRIRPRFGELHDRILSRWNGNRLRSKDLFRRTTDEWLNFIGDLHARVRRGGVVEGHLQSQTLFLHGRKGEDIRRMDAATHHEGRFVQHKAGLRLTQDRHIERAGEIEMPERVRDVAQMLRVGLIRETVEIILERHPDFVGLPRFDGGSHIAIPDGPAVPGRSARLAVDENRGDHAFGRDVEHEGFSGQTRRHLHPRAEMVAMDVGFARQKLVAIAGNRDRMPGETPRIGNRLHRPQPIIHDEFVIARVLPQPGQRERGLGGVADLRNGEELILRGLVCLGHPACIAGLDVAIGMKGLRRQAKGVHPKSKRSRLAVLAFPLVEPDLQRVVSRRQILSAQLQPSHRSPDAQFLHIQRALGIFDRMPLALIDPPIESAPALFVADVHPQVVICRRRDGRRIAQDEAGLGYRCIDLVGIDHQIEPFAIGKNALRPGADRGDKLDRIKGGWRFAFQPNEGGGFGSLNLGGDQKEKTETAEDKARGHSGSHG